MGRAPCCDKANVKRGPWSPEEDATLKSYIEKHGTGGNWIALPTKAGIRRCGKSCRLRWLNYLRPGIKHGGFTDEEDRIICTLYSQMGSRWSVIASQLHGRTDNDVKNYWNTRLKKKLLAAAKSKIKSSSSNNNTEYPNLLGSTTSPPSLLNMENYIHNFSSTSLTPSSAASPMLTDVNYGPTANTQNLIHDPINFPYLGLTNMCEFSAMNSHTSTISSSQEASSVSGSSSLSLALDEKCVSLPSNGGGDQDNGILMDLGFGFPYDVISGFAAGHEVVPNSSPSLVDSTLYGDIKPQGLLQSVINPY